MSAFLLGEIDLIDMADLDNFAFPLAVHLRSNDLVSAWCTTRHAETSTVRIAKARATQAPTAVLTVRTTASTQTKAFKEQVRASVAHAAEIPGRAISLQIALFVGPRRNFGLTCGSRPLIPWVRRAAARQMGATGTLRVGGQASAAVDSSARFSARGTLLAGGSMWCLVEGPCQARD
jgi:hypothetical protein